MEQASVVVAVREKNRVDPAPVPSMGLEEEALPKAPAGAFLAAHANLVQATDRALPNQAPFPLAEIFQRVPSARITAVIRDHDWRARSPGEDLTSDDLEDPAPQSTRKKHPAAAAPSPDCFRASTKRRPCG